MAGKFNAGIPDQQAPLPTSRREVSPKDAGEFKELLETVISASSEVTRLNSDQLKEKSIQSSSRNGSAFKVERKAAASSSQPVTPLAITPSKAMKDSLRSSQAAPTSKSALLLAKQLEADGTKESKAESAAPSLTKEVSVVRGEKTKLDSQVNDLLRANAKLRESLSRAGEKSPGLSLQLATIQNNLSVARAAATASAEEARSLHNQIRGKDRELARLDKVTEEVAALTAQNGALDCALRAAGKAAEDAHAEGRLVAAVARAREADVARLDRELTIAKAALSQAGITHANTTSQLKVVTVRATELEVEVGLLHNELARTGAVAARVAEREVKAGSKDEGMVPVLQHLEELKFASAESSRLREKVASLEKQLVVSGELTERYRVASEKNGLRSFNPELAQLGQLTSRRSTIGSSSVQGLGHFTSSFALGTSPFPAPNVRGSSASILNGAGSKRRTSTSVSVGTIPKVATAPTRRATGSDVSKRTAPDSVKEDQVQATKEDDTVVDQVAPSPMVDV